MNKSLEWLMIWQKKYAPGTTTDAHKLDGYDHLSTDQFERLAAVFIDMLRLSGNEEILEVGCGSGAFLEQIKGYKTICGVDYSENAVSLIRKLLKGDFFVAEANCLPFENSRFDIVMSLSAFIYFDSLSYAKKTLEEMIRVLKPKGKVFIGDINDLAKKDFALQLRKRLVPTRPEQLYYDKQFFCDIASDHQMSISFFDEDVDKLNFFEPSRYRFSVVMS